MLPVQRARYGGARSGAVLGGGGSGGEAAASPPVAEEASRLSRLLAARYGGRRRRAASSSMGVSRRRGRSAGASAMAAKPRPAWDDTTHDLTALALTMEEVVARKLAAISPHTPLLRGEIERKLTAAMATRTARLAAAGVRDRAAGDATFICTYLCVRVCCTVLQPRLYLVFHSTPPPRARSGGHSGWGRVSVHPGVTGSGRCRCGVWWRRLVCNTRYSGDAPLCALPAAAAVVGRNARAR